MGWFSWLFRLLGGSMTTMAAQQLEDPQEIQGDEDSAVNKGIWQYVEVRQPVDRFRRLLQLLGEWTEGGKVLVLVDSQERCDQVFRDLRQVHYECRSLHGGLDQMDRESTIRDFETGVCDLLIATTTTSVAPAAGGLVLKDLTMVINYEPPALPRPEGYVHVYIDFACLGHTGRAGNKGTTYTFICKEEEEHAPYLVEALQDLGEAVPMNLMEIAHNFTARRHREEVQAHAGSSTSALNLRRLGFVAHYTSKASGYLSYCYNLARTYVPKTRRPQFVSWQQIASKHGQPVVNKLADGGKKILLAADGQMDGFITNGVSFYNGSTKELQKFVTARDSVVKRFQYLTNFAQKEGLAGSIGCARVKAGKLHKEGLSYAKKIAQDKSQAMLGLAQDKSKQARDILMKQPLYKKAYDSSHNLLGALQDTTVYKRTVKRIYPVVAPIADPAIGKLQPYYKTTLEFWRPLSAAYAAA